MGGAAGEEGNQTSGCIYKDCTAAQQESPGQDKAHHITFCFNRQNFCVCIISSGPRGRKYLLL